MNSIDPIVPLALQTRSRRAAPRRRALRFALGCFVLGLGLGLWLWLSRGQARPALAVLSIASTVVLAALVRPNVVLGLRGAWLRCVAFLGAVNTTLLLSILYVLLVIPIGLILRIAGRDPLRRRPTPPYFQARAAPRDPSHFEHPY
jgi:hypothetical protein